MLESMSFEKTAVPSTDPRSTNEEPAGDARWLTKGVWELALQSMCCGFVGSTQGDDAVSPCFPAGDDDSEPESAAAVGRCLVLAPHSHAPPRWHGLGRPIGSLETGLRRHQAPAFGSSSHAGTCESTRFCVAQHIGGWYSTLPRQDRLLLRRCVSLRPARWSPRPDDAMLFYDLTVGHDMTVDCHDTPVSSRSPPPPFVLEPLHTETLRASEGPGRPCSAQEWRHPELSGYSSICSKDDCFRFFAQHPSMCRCG